MKATDMLNKVKEVIGIELSEETQEIKLAQATLENGTIIEAEEFAEGKEVFIVTEDEKVALPVGDYKLEDGQELIIEEEGIIKSIGEATEEAPEEAPAEEEVEAAEEEKEEMAYATKEDLAEVKSMIDEIKAMIDKKDELSVEKTVENIVEEVKEELSEVEKVNHNPEASVEKELNLYSQKRGLSTLDRVFQKMNKLNNK
jgi:predicted Rossmann fold nucleotide-binding protein DprA/Smf involved in DNA uptake